MSSRISGSFISNSISNPNNIDTLGDRLQRYYIGRVIDVHIVSGEP